MKGLMDSIQKSTGIDSNTAYTLLIAVATGLVLPIVSAMRRKYEDNEWRIKAQYESDLFFFWMVFFSIFESLLVNLVLVFVYTFLLVYISESYKSLLCLIMISMASLIIWIWHFHTAFIKRRVFAEKKIVKWLCFFPVLILNLVIWTGIANITVFDLLLRVLFVLVEVWGMIYFYGRYVWYKYSYATIYLKNGEKIKEIDIECVKRRFRWLIIKRKEREYRISIEEISSIEYYGDTKIVLINNVFTELIDLLIYLFGMK